MISPSGTAASGHLRHTDARSWKVRSRVAATAAEQVCLFAVTLQWSTQFSAACLTAERYGVTLILSEIQHGCFTFLPLLSLPPMRYHPYAPPNSALLWLPINWPAPAVCSSFLTTWTLSLFVSQSNIHFTLYKQILWLMHIYRNLLSAILIHALCLTAQEAMLPAPLLISSEQHCGLKMLIILSVTAVGAAAHTFSFIYM